MAKHSYLLWLFIFLGVLFLFVAWQPSAPIVVLPAQDDSALHTPSSWVWRDTSRASGTSITPGSARFVITFGSEGVLTMSGDCNEFIGTYELGSGRQMTVKSLASTKKFCGDSIEEIVVGDLVHVESYIVSGGTLTLVLKESYGAMSFTKK